MSLWKHFDLDDPDDQIACPCCHDTPLSDLFYRHMDLLDRMRDELGFPIIITSGKRCPKHNHEVGGAVDSWHLRFATDIRPGDRNPEKLHKMYRKAKELGFTGIGRARTFLHVDLRPVPVEWRY